MAEIGGKGAATTLRGSLAQLRAISDDLKLQAGAVVTKFTTEAGNLKRAIKAIDDEAEEMARTANEILGNAPPGDPTSPQKGDQK